MLESRRRIELTEIHAESNSKLLDPCEQLLERERERVGFSKDRDEERERVLPKEARTLGLGLTNQVYTSWKNFKGNLKK